MYSEPDNSATAEQGPRKPVGTHDLPSPPKDHRPEAVAAQMLVEGLVEEEVSARRQDPRS